MEWTGFNARTRISSREAYFTSTLVPQLPYPLHCPHPPPHHPLPPQPQQPRPPCQPRQTQATLPLPIPKACRRLIPLISVKALDSSLSSPGFNFSTPSVQNHMHELAKTLPPPRKQNTACDACRLVLFQLNSSSSAVTDRPGSP